MNNLLTEKDFSKISKYLNGVINMDVKLYPSFKGKPTVKEIILEYNDGKKLVGDLNSFNFCMKEMSGMSSIVEYFARGKYGQTNWRGNCSGLLIKDLLQFFKPKFAIDPMCGSGTFGDVCKELNVPFLQTDLNPKWGGLDVLKDEFSRSSDFIFVHPPYFVYPGSSMPQYSGKMWGNTSNPDDGSWIQSEEDFTRWFNKVQSRVYQGLRKGGIVCYLMGDSRYRGQYYSMFKNMNIYGDLQNVVIKRQFNCISSSTSYSGKLIPIEHEYLVIIKKNDEYEIKCLLVKKEKVNMMDSPIITWRSLIQNIIEHYKKNGYKKVPDEKIIEEMKKHPKAKNNSHINEKFRQIVNTYKNEFVRSDDGCVDLVA